MKYHNIIDNFENKVGLINIATGRKNTQQQSISMESLGTINLYDFHKAFNQKIQLSYKGPFDKHILAAIGNYIKTVLRSNPKVSKKVFSIFIELAQNIAYYSAEVNNFADEQETGVGTLVIGEFDQRYTFHAGNTVKNEDIVPVIDKCRVINSLDRQGLRKYKRELRNQPQGKRGGAHIGLIQVALTAANPLDIEVIPIDDEFSFFSLAVSIEKI